MHCCVGCLFVESIVAVAHDRKLPILLHFSATDFRAVHGIFFTILWSCQPIISKPNSHKNSSFSRTILLCSGHAFIVAPHAKLKRLRGYNSEIHNRGRKPNRLLQGQVITPNLIGKQWLGFCRLWAEFLKVEMPIQNFLFLLSFALFQGDARLVSATEHENAFPSKPNFLIIYGDDVGYGDLNCYGHPTSRTPRLDEMASQGTRLMDFYSAAPICSPSRASLMTGRLYPRTGVYAKNKTAYAGTGLGVFLPDGKGGMLLSELTLPQLLKPLGYATGMVGKWHLGIGENGKYLPHKRGFDTYFGLPMTQSSCHSNAGVIDDFGPCPVMRNGTVVSQPGDILHVDSQYIDFAKTFLLDHHKEPFLFYFASHHTHRPQFAAPPQLGSTKRGIFGDALAELDWSVGELLDQLRALELQERTLVVFTSDNGPELKDGETGGEQGPLKCGKGTTWEGGMREPAIFWWPGVIPAGVVQSKAIGSTLDILPTFVKLAGGHVPNDRTIDGYDLMPALLNKSSSGLRDHMLFYSGNVLMAVRLGAYKLHYWTAGSHCNNTYPDRDSWSNTSLEYRNPPLLFNLQKDPKERDMLDVSKYTSVVEEMNSFVAEHNKTMTFGDPQIDVGEDVMLFPCCNPECSPRPSCCACSNYKPKPHTLYQITNGEFKDAYSTVW